MWMCFDCDESTDFAIRPFVGGINGITGDNILSYSSEPESSIKEARQDYITVPAQTRLDGISSHPGVVKQFVATRLSTAEQHQGPGTLTLSTSNSAPSERNVQRAGTIAGESRTIECQMTGKDEIGGIQLQIIPKFETKRIFAGSMKDVCPTYIGGPLESYQPVPTDAKVYDVLKTPRELGLHDGDTIHVKTLQEFNPGLRRTKLVQDLIAEAPKPPGGPYDIDLIAEAPKPQGRSGGIELRVHGEMKCREARYRAGRAKPMGWGNNIKVEGFSSLVVMVGRAEVFRGSPRHASELKEILCSTLGIIPHRQVFKRNGIEFPNGVLTKTTALSSEYKFRFFYVLILFKMQRANNLPFKNLFYTIHLVQKT